MSNIKPIAFFDSGVGLFSIVKETKKLLPTENFLIFADQANNPYGEKSQKQIRKYAKKATEFLIKKHNIKMMVLASNTSTIYTLDLLRRKFQIPFVGVVPAIKPAAKNSKKSKIVVMSTAATTKSIYLEGLIQKFAPKSQVLKISCPGLVEAIEVFDKKKIDFLLDKYTQEIVKFKADVLVLGCTHYPLVKIKIKEKLPSILIIDSGKAVAKRIKRLLEQKNQKSTKKVKDIYYTTGNPENFSKISSRILKQPVRALPISFNYD